MRTRGDSLRNNAKLKKKLLQEKKIAKKIQEELEALKTQLYAIQSKNEEHNSHNAEEFKILRRELKEKMDLVDLLESKNRQLEVKAKKAENEAREAIRELEQINEQDEDGNFENQNIQISQMREDMKRLLEFKNELEGLIEEQNKDIEDKTFKINELLEELASKNAQNGQVSNYIQNLEKQNRELKSKLNQSNTKLNHLKQGKITELSKKVKDLTSEVDLLKEMVKSSKNEMRAKEINLKKYKQRLTSLEKISKIRQKVQDAQSIGSQISQRSRSRGRQFETYE